MLDQSFVVIVNHLLGHTPGASERLATQAGRTATIRASGFSANFVVLEKGVLQAPPVQEPAGTQDQAQVSDVVISLSADSLLAAVRDPDFLMRGARIEGDAHFAEVLGGVLRSLNWDIAEDLSKVFGDTAAERVVAIGKSALANQKALHSRMQQNAVEYLVHEQGVLISRPVLDQFSKAVSEVRDDLARLEKRLQKLI